MQVQSLKLALLFGEPTSCGGAGGGVGCWHLLQQQALMTGQVKQPWGRLLGSQAS